MAKFDAEFYQLYRPLYPEAVFTELPALLKARGFRAPFEVADIGCGTGQSTQSLLRSGVSVRVHAVEPDALMLEKARNLEALPHASVSFSEGRGEGTGLGDGSVDAVMAGSSFHWMDAVRTKDEFFRILRPGGVVLIFEYQFPKGVAQEPLNEWIRRQFNLFWKAPDQKPRGDFEHVTRCFREDPRFELLAYRKVPMVLELDWKDLSGLLLSQSRVLHFESGMTPKGRAEFHESVRSKIRSLIGEQPCTFDFALWKGTFLLTAP